MNQHYYMNKTRLRERLHDITTGTAKAPMPCVEGGSDREEGEGSNSGGWAECV